ncbi:MAG: hypothetical protein JKY67_19540 [Pseudomonadales bacterium]|nr:hypothetical protein [Pseudomonadales bacterium]
MRVFVFFLLSVLITTPCFAMSDMPPTDDRKDIEALENSARWIFEQGYPLYKSYKGYQENSERHWEYIHKIIDKHDVNSHAIDPDTGFPTAPLQAMFSIRKGRFGLSLSCYRRQYSESGKVYEVWHKKITCSGLCKDHESFTSILTIADGMFSRRQITHESDQFVQHYRYPDGTEIKMPITPNMAGALKEDVRLFPAAFKGSSLEGRAVKLDRKVGWVWDE